MKKIVLLCVLCLSFVQTWAINRLYINDFSINPGETVDVSIMLDNDVTTFASFQADLYLPNGLELVEQYDDDDEEYFTFALTTRARSRMAIGSAVQSDGAIRLLLTQTMGSGGNTTLQTIKETSGALVTFQLKASESASGTLYINLRNVVFTTTASERYPLADTQAVVSISGTTPSTGLTVSAGVLNLLTGTSQALVLTPSTSGATWTSSNTAVATVSSNGVVTAVAPGSATITCTANGVSSTPFPVNVISLGDMNHNGSVTLEDVTALVNAILGR